MPTCEDVPERLRRFDPRWLDLAATGPEGVEDALRAATTWAHDRTAWSREHGTPGDVVLWLRDNVNARRAVFLMAGDLKPWHTGYAAVTRFIERCRA
jgi:hypothetical protein